MRCLIIATLSALILLCTPFSDLLGCGLHSIRWTPLIINLLGVGAPAASSLGPAAPPVQASAGERGAAPTTQDSVSLELGKPVERELSSGQSHLYKVSMTSGQYLRITVSQQGLDLLVALFTSDDNKIGEVDIERATVGSKAISAIAEVSGAYRIEVSSAEKTVQADRYEIKVEELREATTEDKYRVAAEALFREADQLKEGTLEAKIKSIEKYHEALELYRRGGDRKEEAGTLHSIGKVHSSLGETLKALEKYNEALPVRPELGEYRIVHFATHGILNNILPELSGIVLSLVDKEGQQQDGFLRLQDIYNLKLSAELIVLTACQTGLGKEIKGEGLIGLARGFMYAGAPRVVASLWKVDDRATSELMKRFYQGMLGPEALRPAGALRQAQLSILKEKQWREPYYWAAFVQQGEWK